MKFGNYEAHSILTGTFALDGGAMFGTVPKVIWDKSNPADELNRIDMEARCLLLCSGKNRILVDVGLGDSLKEKYGENFAIKFHSMYKLNQKQNTLLGNLKVKGIEPADITHVVLTHLHFDHAGGATTFTDGKLVPTFPKAKYFVQKENLETAKKPNKREKASYLSPNFDPLIEAGVLELLDGEVQDFLPDLDLILTFGHTKAQQLARVKDGPRTALIYGGDVIATSSHIRGPFVMGYDLNPILVMEEKEKILTELSENDGVLFFEHDPYMAGAKIEKRDSDFMLKEKVQF